MGTESDNKAASTEQSPLPKSELESSISDEVRDRLNDLALEDRDRVEARNEHRHHLVRETTSKKSFRRELGQGAEAEVTAGVPDMYCFTCGEWVGLSGVDLTGTPRSKADAYYLHGPPAAIRDLRHEVRLAFDNLLGATVSQHPEVETREAAADFVRGEIEQVNGLISTAGGNGLATIEDTDS